MEAKTSANFPEDDVEQQLLLFYTSISRRAA